LAKYRETGLLLLRATLGVAFILIVAPIMFSSQSNWARFGSAIAAIGMRGHYAGWGFTLALFVCIGAILIIFGLFFRLGVLFCLVVAFLQTIAVSKGANMHAVLPHLEVCAVLLSVLFIGPGKYSVEKD
jgi:putative oxidoreductase